MRVFGNIGLPNIVVVVVADVVQNGACLTGARRGAVRAEM